MTGHSDIIITGLNNVITTIINITNMSITIMTSIRINRMVIIIRNTSMTSAVQTQIRDLSNTRMPVQQPGFLIEVTILRHDGNTSIYNMCMAYRTNEIIGFTVPLMMRMVPMISMQKNNDGNGAKRRRRSRSRSRGSWKRCRSRDKVNAQRGEARRWWRCLAEGEAAATGGGAIRWAEEEGRS